MTTKMEGYFREEFPITQDRIFMNCASKAPLPLSAFNALQQYFRKNVIEQIVPQYEQLLENYEALKANIGELIHADMEEIAITANTSVGINIALNGYNFKVGDEVILPKNDFPCNIYPWLEHAKSRPFTVKFAGTSHHCTTDDILNAISPQTRIVSVSFIDFATGYCMDLERIGWECRARDILFVVDGIQGVGARSIDVKATHIDVLACGGPKWLLTPHGIGFAYINKDAFSKIDPKFVGWLSFGWEDFSDFHVHDHPLLDNGARYEVGTLPHAFILTFRIILEKFFLEIGVKTIESYLRAYTQKLISLLEEYGFAYVGSKSEIERSQVLQIAAPSDPQKSFSNLKSHNVDISLREGHLRFSPHFFNNDDDLDRLDTILKSITK